MVVVGGGIAGLSAAACLADRGVRVSVVEREAQLGGRVRSWTVRLDDGSPVAMSRGFHAFFRQYYQLRALLRRADPTLACLRAVEDYPLSLKDGPTDSFAAIPRTPPWNLAGFVLRSPTFRLAHLARVDVDAAMGLLDVTFPQTFHDLDGRSAADVLDELRFPGQARHLALEVFARSFFADPREFSGAELVAMFHTYFVGSAEGLLFDVAADDFDTALWAPLAAHLSRQGVQICTGTAVDAIEELDEGVRVHFGGRELDADAVVLAADQRATQALVRGAEWLGDRSWRARLLDLPSAPAFAVWRRWYDRPTREGAPGFLGTSGYGPLDNVSLVHHLERGSAEWARAVGGSVVELHAYALPDGADHAELRRRLDREQGLLHPELNGARVLGEEWLVRQDCPLVDTRPWRERPDVLTSDPRVVIAGDGVRCDLPVALMERAATTGVQAADALVQRWGARGHDVWTAPVRPRWRSVPTLRRLARAIPASG